ncbi:choline/carnitine O-acyltransferase [Hyalangium versicolor]|uniref:choline/carnitine O-acyltransferase n=1 Tax=Hyalangium versicolor TaxID=2861190 RepID=UPI001CCB3140|nr:choline/carnitine O-acyltransferase [Hyalangium versicolor]
MSLLTAVLLLGGLAYLVWALFLYFSTPDLDTLDVKDRRESKETCFKNGTSHEEPKRYPLYVGPPLHLAYRQILALAVDNAVLRALVNALTWAFLIAITPIRHLLWHGYLNNIAEQSFIPRKLYDRVTTDAFGGAPLLTNPLVVLEDDDTNPTLETRAASLIIGGLTFWRNLKAGNIVNLTRGLRCTLDETFFLFNRCSGLHELSLRPDISRISENMDLAPDSYIAVLIGGDAYRIDVTDQELTEADRKVLLERLLGIVEDHRKRTDARDQGLSLCTHVYDRRQGALRHAHGDYFRVLNGALFIVSLIPEATPESVNALATEHFAYPESCWHDKGLQFLIYGNGKATAIGRLRNYVLGSSILKTVSYVGQEAQRQQFSRLLAEAQPAAANLLRVPHPALQESEREVLRSYREKHADWMTRDPHVGLSQVGRDAFARSGGPRLYADSLFQLCLHAAYTKVFGHFPLVTEAAYLGSFQGIVSGVMEFSGTREMKALVERLVALDVSSEVPHARLHADAELAGLLSEAAKSHNQLTRLVKHGFLTPNRLLGWLRTFTFLPSNIAAILWNTLVPRSVREAAPVRWLGAGLARLPVPRMLTISPIDVASSHLPPVPGSRAAVIQSCRFDKAPPFFTPEPQPAEKRGNVYRPKVLVHYSLFPDRATYSVLCFSQEALARREHFIQTIDFYLRVCASLCGAEQALIGQLQDEALQRAVG